MFILDPDPDFFPSRIPDPHLGIRSQKSTGSRILIRNTAESAKRSLAAHNFVASTGRASFMQAQGRPGPVERGKEGGLDSLAYSEQSKS